MSCSQNTALCLSTLIPVRQRLSGNGASLCKKEDRGRKEKAVLESQYPRRAIAVCQLAVMLSAYTTLGVDKRVHFGGLVAGYGYTSHRRTQGVHGYMDILGCSVIREAPRRQAFWFRWG